MTIRLPARIEEIERLNQLVRSFGELHVEAVKNRIRHELIDRQILAHVEAGERKLLIDCTNLQYVNSAGLKVFLLVAKKLEGSGKLVVCSLAPSVLMIFEMIGFTRIMPIVPTREEGLARFLDTPDAA